MVLGAKRLGYVDSTTVENRGETTRGGGGGVEGLGGTTGGNVLGRNVLLPKGSRPNSTGNHYQNGCAHEIT